MPLYGAVSRPRRGLVAAPPRSSSRYLTRTAAAVGYTLSSASEIMDVKNTDPRTPSTSFVEVANGRRSATSTHHNVHRVTDAPTTQADDMKPRMLKYGISMGFRIVFFPVAVFLLDGWMRIAAMIIVLVLPWIAVVIANAGRETTEHSEDLIDTPPRTELGDTQEEPDEESSRSHTHDSTILHGEVVDNDTTKGRGRKRNGPQ